MVMTGALDFTVGVPPSAWGDETVAAKDVSRGGEGASVEPWSRWSRPSGDAARDAARAEVKRMLASPELRQMSARLAVSDRAASAVEEPSENMVPVCTPRQSPHPARSTARPPADDATRSRRLLESAYSAEEFEARNRRAFRRGCMVGISPAFLVLFLFLTGEGYRPAEVSLADDGSMTADRLTVAAVDAPAFIHPASARGTSSTAESNIGLASSDPLPYAEALPRSASFGGQAVNATGTNPSAGERDVPVSETVPQPTWSPSQDSHRSAFIRLPGVPDTVGESAVVKPTPPQGHFRPEETPADQVDSLPELALKSSQAARIVVHYKDAEEAAADLVEVLQTLGFAQSELRRVPHRIENRNVRFFHEQNRRIAEDVSDILRAMGSRSEVRDFTHLAPSPSFGTIEVWLNG